jgi:hypothetical protein
MKHKTPPENHSQKPIPLALSINPSTTTTFNPSNYRPLPQLSNSSASIDSYVRSWLSSVAEGFVVWSIWSLSVSAPATLHGKIWSGLSQKWLRKDWFCEILHFGKILFCLDENRAFWGLWGHPVLNLMKHSFVRESQPTKLIANVSTPPTPEKK